MLYSRKDIVSKLNPHFVDRVGCPDAVKVYTIPAKEIIFHPCRFDLVIKYLYVKYRETGIDIPFIKELYALHLTNTDGSFFEADGSKHSLECYFDHFHKTIDSIREHGFDPDISIVPVNSDKQILDGAHRVAASAYFGTDVTVAEFDYGHDFSYNFYLEQKKMPLEFLDFVALNYCMLNEKTYIVNFRSIAEGQDSEAEKILKRFCRIFYKKEINFSFTGSVLREYIFYRTEKWIGSPADGFSGARSRAEQFRHGRRPTRVYVVECPSLEGIKEAKVHLRDFYGMNNDPVHITDTREETLDLARLYFNENTLHLVNNLMKYPDRDFLRLFQSYKYWLKDSGVDSEDVVVDGSSVMSLYDLRKSCDIDYLAHGVATGLLNSDLFDQHDSELKHHAYKKLELIYDPRSYLYFENIKFVSLAVLKKMKERRGELPKDVNDIKLINSVLGGGKQQLFDIRYLKLRLSQLLSYLKAQVVKALKVLAPEDSFRRGVLKKINHYRRLIAGLVREPKVLYYRLIPGAIHEVNYCGYKLFFSKKTSIVERYLADGTYEPNTLDALFSVLDSSAGPRKILDIGANIGMISLAMVKRYPEAEIFAFEPGPHQAELFRRTIEENGLQGRIRLSQVALSDTPGESSFSVHATEHASGDGFLDSGRAGDYQTITVKTDTLDNWWLENGKPSINMIKMDVEGAELLVMRGAMELIKQMRPSIVFEIHPDNLKPYSYSSKDILEFFEEYGYKVLNLDGCALGGNQREQLFRGCYSGELWAQA